MKQRWCGQYSAAKRSKPILLKSVGYCQNSGCSNYSADGCELWTECPMFRGGTVQKQQEAKKKAKPTKATLSRTTEDDEQAVVIQYCELHKIVVAHIPNEGKRSQAYGARMQRLGMRKGFPDLFFPTPRGVYHGLFIEMKRDKKAHVTAEQKEWLSYLSIQGYRAVVCRGADEAIAEIKQYFSKK